MMRAQSDSGGQSEVVAAVNVKLAETLDKGQRKQLIDELFSGVEFNGREHVKYQGNEFTAIRGNDRAKMGLMQLFGSSKTLAEVDESIRKLEKDGNGWLNSTKNQSITIKSGEINADLQGIAELVSSSLSSTIVANVQQLLSNVHKILSGDMYWSTTSEVDVNIFQRNGSDIVVIHSRYVANTKKTGLGVLILSGKRRKIELSFNLRNIGITHHYWEELGRKTSERASTQQQFFFDHGLVPRTPMTPLVLPMAGHLRYTKSAPAESPPITKRTLPNDDTYQSHDDE